MKGDVVISKKDFIKEHRKLIKLLTTAGKEGKDQMKELKKMLKK